MKRFVNQSLLSFLAALLTTAVVAPEVARADDVVDKVVVRNRQFRTAGSLEVSPFVGFAVTNRLTSLTNFQLGVAYNFSEVLALEARGGYALSDFTDVGLQAREKLFATDPLGSLPLDEYSDLWRVEWQALLMPRWTPIYGKLNLVTEVPIHFQAYLTAGGGAVGLMQESVAYCQNGGSSDRSQCGGYLQENQTTWAVAGGAGFRFFLNETFMVRMELFDIAYPDSYRKGINRIQAEKETPGSEPREGTVTNAGLTNNLLFNLGASVVF